MVPNEEQKALQEMARRFARERLLPNYQKREKAGRQDRALIKEMAGLGFLGVDLPSSLGGLGVDSVTSGLIIEELAYGDFSVSTVPLQASLVGSIIAKNAQADVAAEWIPQITAGDVLFGLCLTEPRGGSDAGHLVVRAKRQGDDYVLNGEKTSISFAHCADAFIVFARTGTLAEGARGVSAFVVPRKTPGIKTTRFDDVGAAIIERGSVFFDEVRIPARYRIGDEGKGFTQVMVGFDFSRALIVLQCIAAAQASLDEAWSYTKEREQFGRPIAQFQNVTSPLVEGEAQIAAVRQLCYHTLALRDAGLPHTAEAAMVKWLGPKTAFEVIHHCLLTFGHYGFTKETPHQQRLRDVMGQEIGDGTAGIMKLVVARERVGRCSVQYAP